MSSQGTIANSHKRRCLVLQPPREEDAPPDATCPSSPVLPEDLMLEILLRLSVKSLLRFRCICKSFKCLISSSDFVKNHLHRSATDPNFRHHRLLGHDSSGDGFRFSRSLPSLLDNPSLSPPIFDNVSFQLCRHSLIVGSCNGLICWVNFRYYNNHYVRYLNPSTRLKSKSPCFRHPWRDGTCFTMFGFGYDHLSDSYKTVAIYCDPKAEKIEEKTIVKVYTLGGARSWRKMQNFPFDPRPSISYDEHCGKFVSGTLNWLATRVSGSLVVVFVDLGEETCGEVLLPHVVDKSEVVASPKLWVLSGCLCFSYDVQFVLWQMKLYGVTESWTILVNISYLDVGIIDHHFHCYPKPFIMLDTGEVLLKIKGYCVFILYNPRHNSFKYLDFRSYTIWFEGTTHIESLVSPCPTRLFKKFVSVE